MAERKRIVFVDDEPRVLDGIRRMLHSLRDEWEMSFVGGGREALDLMAKERVDVIVTDIRMPEMTGTELLEKVRDRYPATVRIALSGQADKDSMFKSVGPIHQYLSKPCEAETLRSTVIRVLALRGMLANEKLERAISGMESLPSLPENYNQLLRELESPNASIKSVERIISRDMGMSAKLLQLVNSAFFGVGRRVSNPAQAVVLLGLDTVKNLVLTTHVFSQFKGINVPGFSLQALWNHSVASAGLAKRIAVAEGAVERTREDTFVAGLLHDVGKLLLASKLPDDYGRALKLAGTNGRSLSQAERETLGASHAEVGAYLLGLWGLSETIVEPVAYHHCPEKGTGDGFTPLVAVHVADAIARGCAKGDPNGSAPGIDADYVGGQGLGERLAVWQEICRKALEEEEKR